MRVERHARRALSMTPLASYLVLSLSLSLYLVLSCSHPHSVVATADIVTSTQLSLKKQTHVQLLSRRKRFDIELWPRSDVKSSCNYFK